MMTLEALQTLLDSGEFHHATYRNHGSIWEGLYIYKKENNGFNGFTLAGAFSKGPDSDEAHKLVRQFGVYEGAYK